MAVDFPREVALKIIYDINEKGAYSNISINKNIEGQELRELDKAFITELVYGTIKWKLSIDYIIQQFSNIKLKKLSPWILNVLRLGVYQLLYTDRIPPSAACNESVGLAKKYGHSASSGFVNAILRNITRNKEKIKFPDKDNETLRYLSIKYSHPEWMVKAWLDRFGPEFAESLLESNNQVPEFSLRVNTLKVSKDKLLEYFNEIGIEAETGRHIPEAIIVRNPSSISKLDAFKNGWFQVQDESSMLVARVLDPKPGELVIDVCSAPGGKSTHIAQLMENKGRVISRDIHEHKIRLIEDSLKRLGIKSVETEVYDATELDDNYIEKADKVLVDAPCTGLGIIRRKPDIKWSRNLDDKREITELQTKIINISSRYVKPGGVLVYSTCTIEPEENEELVSRFIEQNRDFELIGFEELVPDTLTKTSAKDGHMQLYPNIDHIDGFFIAKMRKRI
ncbi:MAG: rRNA ((967)-C(5))-methyltransferase [Clostridiales bacterium]|nr:rRNA ((967)-C(5))-methyltransferase [Clostridiales bacterium]